MIKGQSVIAVIPARGGSKRIPRKNLETYKGRSLIAWAVESARQSKYLDAFALSSEDAAIREHAKQLKVENILERPSWLAGDKAMNEGVLIHSLYTWKWADWVVLLQPTSPQRTGADIDICIERATQGNGCISYDEYGKRNGAVYVCLSTFLVSMACFHVDAFHNFFMMPNERSLDIDYPQDLQRA